MSILKSISYFPVFNTSVGQTTLVLSLALLIVMVSIAGCGDSPPVNKELTPAQLGAIGAEIHKSPENIDSILSEHGLTRPQFIQRIKTIREQPSKASEYRRGFEAELEPS